MHVDIVRYLRLSRTRFNRHAEAADEIEGLRNFLKAFYVESQCIDCFAINIGIADSHEWLDPDHDTENCPVAKLQSQYIDIFGEDDDV